MRIPPAIKEAAINTLALLNAADGCGRRGVTLSNHHPTAGEVALCALLDARCPGLLHAFTMENGRRMTCVSIDAPTGSSLTIFHVAPACVEPVFARRLDADAEAYQLLLRIVTGEYEREKSAATVTT